MAGDHYRYRRTDEEVQCSRCGRRISGWAASWDSVPGARWAVRPLCTDCKRGHSPGYGQDDDV